MDPYHRQRMEASLAALEETHLQRKLRVLSSGPGMTVLADGRPLINFSSNDYLGLAHDPELIEAVARGMRSAGMGATASRLVCGTLPLHQQLEEALADLKGTEAALVLGSGFQTNAGVLSALLDPALRGDTPAVFIDRLGHASMYEGLKTAGVHATRFQHNDLDHLAGLLRKHTGRASCRMILTESVFSMDGDRADLPQLVELAAEHEALLYVDEAHATGILGPGGAGLCADPAVKGRVDVVMGTFGKALGGYGAFTASSSLLREWLVNRCRGFIYSTALPPPSVLAALQALKRIPAMEAERARVASFGCQVRDALRAGGWDTFASTTQIIPVLIGSEQDTRRAADHLETRGILAGMIRPPTVPPGTGRLRVTLTATHTAEDIDQLLHAFASLGRIGA